MSEAEIRGQNETIPSGITNSTSSSGGSSEGDPLPESDVKMTIWEHLGELRTRVFRAAIGLFVCTAACWGFREKILAWLVKPYEAQWIARKFPGVPELQTLGPADVFVGYMQLSLVGGAIFSAPVIFYQLWAFISPGLYSREKRFIVPFVVFSTGLFLSGVFFGYYVAFPFTFSYFFSLLGQVSDAGMVLTQRPTLELYLDFATTMLLAFGFVFELPLFISFLAIAGLVTPTQLVKFSRWAILLSFIVGGVVTPGPEISSQLAVSLALIVLYFVSVVIAFFVAPKKRPDDDDSKAAST
ncbi:twin-arginine translocase subunit TatC [Pendulispora albinea]|uniref:Sec-independent protein translocase protein TatC n=1 Tax=Pendulispora albinea TaxID=2741071 RepID=A0ABZ2LP57_9BACT